MKFIRKNGRIIPIREKNETRTIPIRTLKEKRNAEKAGHKINVETIKTTRPKNAFLGASVYGLIGSAYLSKNKATGAAIGALAGGILGAAQPTEIKKYSYEKSFTKAQIKEGEDRKTKSIVASAASGALGTSAGISFGRALKNTLFSAMSLKGGDKAQAEMFKKLASKNKKVAAGLAIGSIGASIYSAVQSKKSEKLGSQQEPFKNLAANVGGILAPVAPAIGMLGLYKGASALRKSGGYKKFVDYLKFKRAKNVASVVVLPPRKLLK